VATYDPRDKYYRKARAKGLPSRAAFKIEELIHRIKLPPDARVIDLGCAPGGWLAILGTAVGRNGHVIGIDLAACGNFGASVETIVADIRDPKLPDILKEKLGRPADLVTSDLSPKLTGIRDRDDAQFEELIEAALAIASQTLKPGGTMVAKLFMSGAFTGIVARFEKNFAKVEVTKVKATRPGSSELYLIARGHQPTHAR
jgi:23S rRNA (uridine2552-2'-O)-methyltransferase